MDVLLFGASASLGVWLPKPETLESSKSVKLALVLSLGLLSLSILEAAPSQWMIFLEHAENLRDGGVLTITGAYQIILWIVCLWIVVLLPGHVGGRVLQVLERIRTDANEKTRFFATIPFPWWIRYGYTFLTSLLFLLNRVLLAPVCRHLRQRLSRTSSAEPILVLASNSQHGSRQGTKSNSSLHSSPRKQSVASRSYLLGGFCGVMSVILMLRALGPLVIELHHHHRQQQSETQVLSTLVSWLCAVGLMISSILNGFGCVSMPHSCLAGWSLEAVKPEYIAKAEREYRETEQSLESKTEELNSDPTLTSTTTTTTTTTMVSSRRQSSFFQSKKTAAFSDYSESTQYRRQMLQKEIDFLDNLLAEMRVDIQEMKYSYETAVQARTPVGQFKCYVGFVFSAVLLIRLCTAIMSIMHGSVAHSKRADPITTILLWLTGHNYVNQQDYDKVSQGISLVLTAVLSFSQVRTFLRTVASVNGRLALFYRRCSCTRNEGAEQADAISSVYETIYTYFLAAMMGCYFVSCVVLTKMSLPLEYRSGFASALGGMDFTIKSSVVNLVFALSTAVSAAILGILLGIQRQNTKRYAQEAMLPTC